MKKTNAFTSAETLITLGIIGVVAAMTIPNLITKYQEKATVAKLKETFSILSQAYRHAVNEYGTPEGWDILGLNNYDGAKNIYDKISPYLKISKNCGDSTGCFPNKKYKVVGGQSYYNLETDDIHIHPHKFILLNGNSMYIQTRDENCAENQGVGSAANICAFIGVDINGLEKPNVIGRDLFIFMLTKDGIMPRGGKYNIGSTNSSFEQNCINRDERSWACAAWVIYNENMDYLHCDDLSWNGKLKCR